MLRTLNENVRSAWGNGFLPRALRPACALLLALFLYAGAFAYTVVLRGGRRVEIPAQFVVTPLTLTYEAAPGVNVTLLMSTVDVQATERANNEPAGSLMKRANTAVAATDTTATRPQRKRRELTQSDIEAARLARQKSEQDYERRRLELGLPSLEETRRRNQEEARRMGEESLQARASYAQAEAYWRARANALRDEMAALDAQIVYVRNRLSELPEYPALGGYAFVTGFPSVYTRGRQAVAFPAVTGHPGFIQGAGGVGAQLTGFQGYGAFAGTHMQVSRGAAPSGRVNFGRPARSWPRGVVPAVPVFSAPGLSYDYSYERQNLVSRLHDLEAARAGLQARWRSLEEEARRAGAQPGWLRP